MLRRLHQHMADDESKLGRRRSKRQRIVQFLRTWKKPHGNNDVPIQATSEKAAAEPRASEGTQSPASERAEDCLNATPSPVDEMEETTLPPLPSKIKEEAKEEMKDTTLNEEQLHSLFSGAPHFHIHNDGNRPTPKISYPWDQEDGFRNLTDSVSTNELALSAATLLEPARKCTSAEKEKLYKGYTPDVVEMPSMSSAQGIEPGTTGFAYFLQLPTSDALVTETEQSQSGKDFLEASRNKELLQSNPERLGIRQVETDLIFERLIEFQDLYETFQDTPEPMTILNNQSSGDLYANLFTKFLTPPGHDDSIDDPTGLHIQINALLRTLKLKGIWYDFSLVEWRIRLGQILWSEPEPVPEHEVAPMWTEREILLLQISLASELLLRLDAYTNVDAGDAELRLRIDPYDIQSLAKSKNCKIDWDLVLARRFLDNISVIKGADADDLPSKSTSRRLLSLLTGNTQAVVVKSDLILLPQHQTRQLSGLLHFAKTLAWPSYGSVITDLAQKLGATSSEEIAVDDRSPHLSDPTTPSVISVYGTPLQTPLPVNHATDSYFGHIGKPTLARNDSRALRIPLSPTWSASGKPSGNSLENVGGWLSRSYLTGLVLPGEAISHFLVSTLLENDPVAISSLGSSANLYGGFTYAGRTYWSKNSIVGRVLACIEGSVECAGWISCPKVPQNTTGWHSIHSEQLPFEPRIQKRVAGSDVVASDSAIVPGEVGGSVKPEDFVLPLDSIALPSTAVKCVSWELTPINPDLIDNDHMSGPLTESDVHTPSVVFDSQAQLSTYTLAYDVQFITSWPCNPPTSKVTRPSSIRPDLRRSLTDTLSRSSSKRSALSRRNSHGYEPLLSHPPDSVDIAPKRTYDADQESTVSTLKNKAVAAHFLHSSYLHKIVPASEVLDPDFELSFDMHTSKSSEQLLSSKPHQGDEKKIIKDSKKTVLVLDARGATDLELLARAWCAEKGLHAIVGRTGRTCLACCIREARGLGVNVVIRV